MSPTQPAISPQLAMVRNRATYGKKATAPSSFANVYFSDTSSPSQTASTDDSRLPSPRIRKQHAPPKTTKEDIEWQTVIESLHGLQVRDSKLQLSTLDGVLNSPAQHIQGRGALQARDVNTVVNEARLPTSSQICQARERQCQPLPTDINEDFAATPSRRPRHSKRRNARNKSSRQHSPIPSSPKALSTAQIPPSLSGESQKHPEPLQSYAAPLLSLASEAGLVSFSDYSSALSTHFNITKLAEASYGEVYRLSLLPSTSTNLRTAFSHTDESVLKLIALKPPPVPLPSTLTAAGKKRRKMQWTKAEQVRIGSMSRIDDVAGEVKLLKRMSCIPGFTNFRALTVLRGPLPPAFLSAWHTYDDTVKRSEFPDPASPGAYLGDDQLWAMIEMQDAGRDLEAVVMKSVWTVWDAFWGIAIAMAKGEEWARFEHRDLHLGNICVKWDGTGTGSDDINDPPIDLGRNLGYTGLETTIIDYTLSRADMESELRSRPESASPSSKVLPLDLPINEVETMGSIAYLDLSLDSSLFEADASYEYQYEIYRCMRAAAQFSDPLGGQPSSKANKRGQPKQTEQADETAMWRRSHPLTNLVWLHFVLYRLCEGVEAWPSSSTKNRPLYQSRPVQKHAKALEAKLTILETVLALENMNRGPGGDPDGLGNASDLVAWAVQEGWLDEEDVVSCGLGKSDLNEEDTMLELVEGLTIGDGKEPLAESKGQKHRSRSRKQRQRRGTTADGENS